MNRRSTTGKTFRAIPQNEEHHMKFLAQLAVIFDLQADDHYDAWDYFFPLDAGSPREALDLTIKLAKSAFDDAANLAELGYFSKPSLYAVRSLHTETEFPKRLNQGLSNSTLLLKIGCLTRADFDRLRSYESISIPYQVMYIHSESAA
jgi:hypothetical protein